MKIGMMKQVEVEAKTVEVHCKVRDEGCYTLKDQDGAQIAQRSDDYVPGFFPGQHDGDYLILEIELETGRVVNWQRPSPSDVQEAFKLNGETDE